MLTELKLSNFRAFGRLSLAGLTRVNLLVGANNAGKTSVLEAGEILMAGGMPWILLRSPTRRGDGFLSAIEGRFSREAIDIRHLFHGHRLQAGVEFRLDGLGPKSRFVHCRIIPAPVGQQDGGDDAQLPIGLDSPSPLDAETPLAVAMSGDQAVKERILPLGPGALLPFPITRRIVPEEDSDAPVNFVSTADPEYRLPTLWDRIVLTPDEERVTEALQIIEPRIERVASLSRQNVRGPSPVVVRLRGSDERIPIGSMGDGLKRLLVLSVNLVNSAGGCLFVDEIDTGLHHSVIARAWHLIIETARKLDVQVFATTHSLDCIQALARVYEDHNELGEFISVHRIQRDVPQGVRYAADEMLVAIRQEMEIR